MYSLAAIDLLIVSGWAFYIFACSLLLSVVVGVGVINIERCVLSC